MTPTTFPEANQKFRAPSGLSAAQVATIDAHVCECKSGSCDGLSLVIAAWKPDPFEIERINAGHPVFLTVVGGLPPHFLTTSFAAATNPA